MELDDTSHLNIDRICRLCLQARRNMISIFDVQPEDKLALFKRIMTFATIEISEGDGLPSKICSKCVASVNTSYDFKAQIEKADKTLHEYVSFQSDIKNETKNGDWEVSNMEIKEENGFMDNENFPDSEMNEENSVIDKDDLPVHEFVETSLLRSKNKNIKRKYTKYLKREKAISLHPCDYCGKVLCSQKSLNRHNLLQHGNLLTKAKKSYDCLVCCLKFDKWIDLTEHERKYGHHGKEKCKFCDKLFCRNYLMQHMRNHTGEKPYLCTLCGKPFATISSFYKHRKLCSNTEKKFKCSYCDKKFHEKYPLTEHERIHTNERPFVCETCGKAFRRRGKLLIHQLVHTNIKPYECSVCHRSFRQRIHLTEHFRIHSGVKPFQCNICGAAFTQGHSLKTHKSKHNL